METERVLPSYRTLKMFGWIKRHWLGATRWKPPIVKGPSRKVLEISPADAPIVDTAQWEGSSLVVRSPGGATVALFDVPVKGLDHCMLEYRFEIRADNLQHPVYAELLCRIPNMGEFFSRGLDCKMKGTFDWTSISIPFYLQRGQSPDLLHLNLVFEGPGEVQLRNIVVGASTLV